MRMGQLKVESLVIKLGMRKTGPRIFGLRVGGQMTRLPPLCSVMELGMMSGGGRLVKVGVMVGPVETAASSAAPVPSMCRAGSGNHRAGRSRGRFAGRKSGYLSGNRSLLGTASPAWGTLELGSSIVEHLW